MSAEAFAAPKQITSKEVAEGVKNKTAGFVDRTKERFGMFTSRWARAEVTEPTPFDIQFDTPRIVTTPEFPEGLRYAFANPEDPTTKPLVAVITGVHEEPGDAKEFMRHLVENGWPVLSVYSFGKKKDLLHHKVSPAVITQKALANIQSINDVMEIEAIQGFHVFGHSMGGAVGAYVAGAMKEQCISYTGYAAAGMMGEMSRADYLKLSLSNRTVAENLYSIRHTLRRPIQTWHESGGAANIQLSSMLPVINEMGISTYAIFGKKDPLVPVERVQEELYPESEVYRQFDEIAIIESRHSGLFEEPAQDIGTAMRFFHLAEQKRLVRVGKDQTVFQAS